LYRIDDRLIHGQVVVGWGQPLDLRFIVLVDDEVAASDWEQELYRMGVPPDMDVFFDHVEDAAHNLERYVADPRSGLLLTGDIQTMARLVEATGAIGHVNQHLRYVFLTAAEADALRRLAAAGVEVTAQDVPATRPIPLDELLDGTGTA
jgi:PTS system mannose-specific IIB component/fructoselysine and glucoselysine-specific PTS system IIB component